MSLKKRILIIDDEVTICEMIEDLLAARYAVIKAIDAAQGLQAIATQAPNLVILDIKLKGESGLDLCQNLRENPSTRHIPILIYSGSDDIEMLTAAFERGADDFVPKSARPRELIARIGAKIRRQEELKSKGEEANSILTCGNLLLDNRKFEARVAGKVLQLSVLEFNLLRFFVQNKERVMNRGQILAGVWKDSVVSNRTIDTHMVYLRKKLVDFDHSLGTVYGAGYILRETAKDSDADSVNSRINGERSDHAS